MISPSGRKSDDLSIIILVLVCFKKAVLQVSESSKVVSRMTIDTTDSQYDIFLEYFTGFFTFTDKNITQCKFHAIRVACKT